MERAIEIKTTPIVLEMNIKNASIKTQRDAGFFELHKTNGSLDYNITNSKIKIDTYDAKKSIPFNLTKNSVDDYASNGTYKTQKSTANYNREGDRLLDYYVNNNVLAQVSQQKSVENRNSGFDSLSTTANQVSSEHAMNGFSTNFSDSDINLKWNKAELKFEYEPCSFDVVVKQYNKVMINYILGPNYVPPSSDPYYEPVDMYA